MTVHVGKLTRDTFVHLNQGLTFRVPRGTLVVVRGGRLTFKGYEFVQFVKRRWNGRQVYIAVDGGARRLEVIGEVVFPRGGRVPYPFSRL